MYSEHVLQLVLILAEGEQQNENLVLIWYKYKQDIFLFLGNPPILHVYPHQILNSHPPHPPPSYVLYTLWEILNKKEL